MDWIKGVARFIFISWNATPIPSTNKHLQSLVHIYIHDFKEKKGEEQ